MTETRKKLKEGEKWIRGVNAEIDRFQVEGDHLTYVVRII